MRDRTYHSRSYHKFFEDWAERKVYDSNGKMQVERVYIGNYYRSPLSKQKRVIRRIQYILLYALAVAFFVISGTQDVPVNHATIPSLFVAVCIFPLTVLLLPLFRNLTMPEEMIIRQYRAASLDLIRISAVSAGVLAVTALVQLLFLVVMDNSCMLETILCAAGYLIAAGGIFLLHLLERRLEYEIIPPRADRPENSTVIKFESARPRF